MNKHDYCVLGLTGLMIGFGLKDIQDTVNILHSMNAIYYYRQVHQTLWNQLVHTYCMPITMIGMWLWIPALFQMTFESMILVKYFIAFIYLGMYSLISVKGTIFVFLWYLTPYISSTHLYNLFLYKISFTRIMCIGLLISTISLTVQELLGHYVGGDDPSRFDGIINAILYAPLSSVMY